MADSTTHQTRIDPRTGLLLLVLANAGAFLSNSEYETGLLTAMLFVLMTLCGCRGAGIKFLLVYLGMILVQGYLFPVSPKWVVTTFAIFINYTKRMLPCLMVGTLIVKTVSMSEMVLAMRKLHVPQKLIVAISVTLRYFPAIREEFCAIRDAMKLRHIPWTRKMECIAVPIMMSAASTAEELSAAAVTRGIENPAPKTSIMTLHFGVLDGFSVIVVAALVIAGFRFG